MSKGIELSPKYGVNPTIPVCFFCGEQKSEIVMLGRVRSKKGAHDDLEAPKNMVLDYEPCDKCKELFAKGVLIVEASRTPMNENQPPITPGAYPTGRYVVVSPDAFISNEYKAGDKVLMTEEDFSELFSEVM